MRFLIAALALGVAACDASTTTSENAADAAGGYTLEIRASNDVQSYVVVAPDGRTVGARTAAGLSALMDAERVQALIAEPPPATDDVPEVMSLRLPGFEMAIGANEEDAGGDNGSVSLSIGGEQNVVVRANEGGPGDADDTAYVRITGADEASARDFIDNAEELSSETKSQMLSALGLSAATESTTGN